MVRLLDCSKESVQMYSTERKLVRLPTYTLFVSWVPNVDAPSHLCWDGEKNTFVLPTSFTNHWNQPKAGSHIPSYHPGGVYELRTKDIFGGAGHQAIYDKNGHILNDIPSAGTADRYTTASILSILHFHRVHDVHPFDLAIDLDGGDSGLMLPNSIVVGANIQKYYEVRPKPNYVQVNQSDCPTWSKIIDVQEVIMDDTTYDLVTYEEYQNMTPFNSFSILNLGL